MTARGSKIIELAVLGSEIRNALDGISLPKVSFWQD